MSISLPNWVSERNADIQRCLEETLFTPNAFVEEVARYLVDAGGKRYRPGIVVNAGALGIGRSNMDVVRLVRSATVIELTHVASLYHDDVMDEADTRRGRPATHVKWSNSIAILVGDFMLARASALGATLGEAAIIHQAETLARLVQGQIAELSGPDQGVDPITHHLKVVSDKTASLISTAARFGGLFGGLDPDQVEALAAYGEDLGLAFQLADDLMDLLSDSSGKPQGTDLREGVPTLTTLLVQANPRPGDTRLLELLAYPVADENIPEALGLLRTHPALDEARAQIQTYADQALAHLAVFPPSEALDGLKTLCHQAAIRTT
ncbi:MAG: polyprenyl synthetase family protein [Propionibacteriaceae bacterium]|nr:polyprenyl synthetase family protein [Propionibacteriaceae bacterium]